LCVFKTVDVPEAIGWYVCAFGYQLYGFSVGDEIIVSDHFSCRGSVDDPKKISWTG
jgi:hypothetical protein